MIDITYIFSLIIVIPLVFLLVKGLLKEQHFIKNYGVFKDYLYYSIDVLGENDELQAIDEVKAIKNLKDKKKYLSKQVEKSEKELLIRNTKELEEKAKQIIGDIK